MESTHEYISFYFSLGMPVREISDTLGVSLSNVYRNLRVSQMGRRTLHYFPNLDTSTQQLTAAEQHRQIVAARHHPSKE